MVYSKVFQSEDYSPYELPASVWCSFLQEWLGIILVEVPEFKGPYVGEVGLDNISQLESYEDNYCNVRRSSRKCFCSQVRFLILNIIRTCSLLWKL